MRPLLAFALLIAVSGCEVILGIGDPELIGGIGSGAPDGGGSAILDGATGGADGLACDVVRQDCPNPEDACYFDLGRRTTFCASVPETSFGVTQDQLCAGGSPCTSDSCDKGFGPIGLSTVEAPPDRCAFFCAPVPTHLGNPNMAGGNPGIVSCGSSFDTRPDGPGEPLYQCRFVNSFFSFFPPAAEVPDSVGLCASTELWGDCRNCDPTDPGNCAPGCVPLGGAP